MKSVIEIHYLPCLAYFSVIQDVDTVFLEKNEHFIKQTYRNRCYINTAAGKGALIIPLTGKHGKVLIKDVRIDYSQKWVNNHWRSICSAYRKAPFFEHYSSDLEKTLYQKNTFLYDLNYQLLTMCLGWLHSETRIMETLAYEEKYSGEFLDLRSTISLKNEDYLQKLYEPVSYYQVFGNSFVENLSILDLIFCCGPEAGRILRASRKR